MKMTTRILGLVLITMAVILMNACKAEKGDVGPAGPAGPTGASGATGTANVIYSPWTSVSFTGSGTTYIGSLTAVKLTQDILDKGAIYVYWSESGRVITIPYSQTIGSTAYTVFPRYYVGRIDMVSSYALSAQQIRYVIIPGGVAGGRKAAVDYSDYEAVKAYYGLKD